VSFRHRLEVGGSIRRQPADPADLRLRQQRPFLPAGRRRADQGHVGPLRRRCRVAQAAHRESLQELAKSAGLQSYENSARLRRRDNTVHNWRTACSPVSARSRDRSSRSTTASVSSSLYTDARRGQANELRALRQGGKERRCWTPSPGPLAHCLSAAAVDLQPDAHFTDLGGDSLSALTFANLLHEIFDHRRAGGCDREPGDRSAK